MPAVLFTISFALLLRNTLLGRVVDQVHFEPPRRQFLANIFELTVLYDCIDNTMSHIPSVIQFYTFPGGFSIPRIRKPGMQEKGIR
jgi:hypothetical protein